MYRKKVILIAFLGTFLAVFWQELNLVYLNKSYPSSHGLLTSADEASYLRPPQNLLELGEWKSSGSGIVTYIMRPPGYGIYFLCLKVVFGQQLWVAMKVVQILFYFLSILLFAKILNFFSQTLPGKLKLGLISLYAFLPCYSGFMYFTITESISPFFLLLTTYFWIKNYKHSAGFPWGFILSGGFLILIRPQLMIFVLLFTLVYLLKRRYRPFLFSLLAFLPFLLWNVRSISIAGKWMGIHPIYSETNNSLYRPSHEKMTNLFRIWEHQGDIFHSTIGVLASDTSEANLTLALNKVPQKYQQEVKPIFKNYQQLELYRREHFEENETIKTYFKGEKSFLTQIEKLTTKLRSENKADYYLQTPFRSFKNLLLTSQLNLRIFQQDFRGAWWCEVLRWLCLLILVLSFLSAFYVLFFKKDLLLKLLALGMVCSFFYLAFIQRMNEERYLTPVLPLCLILLSVLIGELYFRKNSKT